MSFLQGNPTTPKGSYNSREQPFVFNFNDNGGFFHKGVFSNVFATLNPKQFFNVSPTKAGNFTFRSNNKDSLAKQLGPMLVHEDFQNLPLKDQSTAVVGVLRDLGLPIDPPPEREPEPRAASPSPPPTIKDIGGLDTDLLGYVPQARHAHLVRPVEDLVIVRRFNDAEEFMDTVARRPLESIIASLSISELQVVIEKLNANIAKQIQDRDVYHAKLTERAGFLTVAQDSIEAKRKEATEHLKKYQEVSKEIQNLESSADNHRDVGSSGEAMYNKTLRNLDIVGGIRDTLTLLKGHRDQSPGTTVQPSNIAPYSKIESLDVLKRMALECYGISDLRSIETMDVDRLAAIARTLDTLGYTNSVVWQGTGLTELTFGRSKKEAMVEQIARCFYLWEGKRSLDAANSDRPTKRHKHSGSFSSPRANDVYKMFSPGSTPGK